MAEDKNEVLSGAELISRYMYLQSRREYLTEKSAELNEEQRVLQIRIESIDSEMAKIKETIPDVVLALSEHHEVPRKVYDNALYGRR